MSTPKKVGGTKHRASPPLPKSREARGGMSPCPPTVVESIIHDTVVE